MSRLGRFLNLEKRRDKGQPTSPQGSSAQGNRFAQMEASRDVHVAQAPRDTHQRFAPLPAFAPHRGPGEPSFTRCAKCHADNNLLERICRCCGLSLQSEAQRAFNEAFWHQRKQEVLTVPLEPAHPPEPPVPPAALEVVPPDTQSKRKVQRVVGGLAVFAVLVWVRSFAISDHHKSYRHAPRLDALGGPMSGRVTVDGISVKLTYARLTRADCSQDALEQARFQKAFWWREMLTSGPVLEDPPSDHWDGAYGANLADEEAWLQVGMELQEQSRVGGEFSWSTLGRLVPASAPDGTPAKPLLNDGIPARLSVYGLRCGEVAKEPLRFDAHELKTATLDFKVRLSDFPVKLQLPDGTQVPYVPPY